MNPYRQFAAALFATSVLSACSTPDTVPMPASPLVSKIETAIVETTTGKIEGRIENGQAVFKGIPYAAPPVGERRWKPPMPVAPWQDVKPAHDFGPACIQPTNRFQSIYAQDIGATSEDCLSLNVWSPVGAKNAPVFVWIHGGALATGSSKETLYEGSRLARKGMVVVSINYRVGVLGYLAHPELSNESPDGVSGNYGLLDQIAALQWVRDNITAFGGDASNVTVAGESAGALSVMYLLAAKPARGLFHKAIIESGYMITTPALKQKIYGEFSGEEVGTWLGEKIGAPNLAALRALSGQEVTDKAAEIRFAPWGMIDGATLTQQLVDTFDAGDQAPVPILVGFNQGEIRSLPMLAPQAPALAAEYEEAIRSKYLDLADEFLRLYPSSDMQESLWANTRDQLYGWTSERIARKHTASGQNVFLYLWDHGYPAADEAGLHAFHASELPYVFGTWDRSPPRWPKNPDTPQEHAFADIVMSYWASFARDGKPTAENSPAWPAYGTEGHYMHFTDVATPAQKLYPGMYELHEEAVQRRRATNQSWNFNTGLWSPPLTK